MMHHSLKSGRRIAKSEWHYLKLKGPVSATERCLVPVLLSNRKLVVCVVQINLREHSGSIQARSELVNPGEWVGIQHSIAVQLPVIYAHSKLAILLPSK
jgi:hypothetical protein